MDKTELIKENSDIKFWAEDFERSCAFTGHREMTEDFQPQLLEETVKYLIDCGVTTFYCGMARGFDLIAGSLILRLKESVPKIRLIACVPCAGQEKYFNSGELAEYERILNGCEEVKILAPNYFKGSMHARDRLMVDRCRYLIAYLRREKGGTYYTIGYARSKGRDIFIV